MTGFLILLDLPKVIDQQWQTSVNSPLYFSRWPGVSPYCSFFKWFLPPFSVVRFSPVKSPKCRILILRNLIFCCFSYCVKVKVAQSCPALCNPIDDTVQGILQARILEWVPFLFSRGSSQPRDQTQVSCIAGRFFYQLSHKGSPRILEWVACPFSRESSQPRNQTRVSCIAGRFFTK